jgi:dTDP-glucose 4,6-dehydratase
MAAECAEAVGRTFNIGSGREISIGALAELIVDMMGREVRIESEDQRLRPMKSEVERLLADNSLAGSILNWKPTVDLETGLQRTIEWFESHAGRYRAEVYNV